MQTLGSCSTRSKARRRSLSRSWGSVGCPSTGLAFSWPHPVARRGCGRAWLNPWPQPSTSPPTFPSPSKPWPDLSSKTFIKSLLATRSLNILTFLCELFKRSDIQSMTAAVQNKLCATTGKCFALKNFYPTLLDHFILNETFSHFYCYFSVTLYSKNSP